MRRLVLAGMVLLSVMAATSVGGADVAVLSHAELQALVGGWRKCLPDPDGCEMSCVESTWTDPETEWTYYSFKVVGYPIAIWQSVAYSWSCTAVGRVCGERRRYFTSNCTGAYTAYQITDSRGCYQ